MATDGRVRQGEGRGPLGRVPRSVLNVLWPTQRILWTREGFAYIVVWGILLAMGLQQQVNLILLVAGLAAGPVMASFLASAAMLRRLQVTRHVPPYVFSGDPLNVDYTLENARRHTAALALFIEDDVVPVDRTVSGSSSLSPRVFYARVPGGGRERIRWQGIGPRARHLPVPDDGAGHPLALRAPRAAGDGERAPRADRVPDRGPAHAAVAPGAAADDGDPPRPPARPLGTAAGIPRPARLPAGRQPAVDSLAHLGPAGPVRWSRSSSN